MNKGYIITAVFFVLAIFAIYMNYASDRVLDLPGKHSRQVSIPETIKKATMFPGRVVQLNTTKGKIEFVLFEKDCPNATAKVMDLINAREYDGVQFALVEDWRIHTSTAKGDRETFAQELLDGLTNAKGTVGLIPAKDDPGANSSAFYILKDPKPVMDGDYTVIGRLINGMEVVYNITREDKILSAKIRPITASDKNQYSKVLKIEAERRVE